MTMFLRSTGLMPGFGITLQLLLIPVAAVAFALIGSDCWLEGAEVAALLQKSNDSARLWVNCCWKNVNGRNKNSIMLQRKKCSAAHLTWKIMASRQSIFNFSKTFPVTEKSLEKICRYQQRLARKRKHPSPTFQSDKPLKSLLIQFYLRHEQLSREASVKCRIKSFPVGCGVACLSGHGECFKLFAFHLKVMNISFCQQ